MPLLQLSQAQFLDTMIAPMTNVTTTAFAVIDIWPDARELMEKQLVPQLVIEKQLVEAVYRNGTGTYEHVLLPSDRPGIVVCIVISIVRKEIAGYYVLNLALEYGQSSGRHNDIEQLAGDGDTMALQELFASGFTQDELNSALENAIAYSQLETAKYLLSLGADLSSNGYNGVHAAVCNNELEGLKFAIAKGVNVNVSNGLLLNAAIEPACNTKSTQLIKWLLANGADKKLLTQDSIERAMKWGTGDLKAIVGPLQVPPKVSPWWKFWD